MPDHDLDHDHDDHDQGLQIDLANLTRRRLFKLAGAAGAAGLVTFGRQGRGTPASADTVCVTIPEETAGPYPGDGSNGVNVLSQSGIVRSDIRSSFGSSTTTATGVPLSITLTIVDTAAGCVPLAGAAVYLWHCSQPGLYSLYSAGATNENYLRGVQVTDANGNVTFTSIFPGCYAGRWPHIHFEVYPNLAATSSASNKIATSQIALPKSACDDVYATTGYAASVTNLANVSLASDGVFGNDGAAYQLGTITGSVAGGLAVALTAGVSTTGAPVTPPTSTTVTPTTSPTTIGQPSAFVPLASPERVLDTRSASQQGYTGAKPAALSTVTLAVLGRSGVPSSGVSAVVLNVTATEATGRGFVTVWPEGTMPTASSLNLERAGQTRANLVTVPVGSDGSVRLFTQGGAHLVADVFGWFTPAASAAAGRFQAVSPGRLLDTRTDSLVGYSGAKPGAATTVAMAVLGRGGVPATGVAAVALNVTATEASAAGFVTVWPDGSRPSTSNLNLAATGDTVANQVVIPVGADGSVRLYSQSGTHLVVDVSGWFTDATAAAGTAGLFVPVSPYRVLDTRTLTKPVAGGSVTLLAAAAGTAAAGRSGLALNLTATDATDAGFVTVWPDGTRPTASSLNCTAAGQTIANHVLMSASPAGGVTLFTQSGTHLVVDVNGWFVGAPGGPGGTPPAGGTPPSGAPPAPPA